MPSGHPPQPASNARSGESQGLSSKITRGGAIARPNPQQFAEWRRALAAQKAKNRRRWRRRDLWAAAVPGVRGRQGEADTDRER
jgi:hypothetical protein